MLAGYRLSHLAWDVFFNSVSGIFDLKIYLQLAFSLIKYKQSDVVIKFDVIVGGYR